VYIDSEELKCFDVELFSKLNHSVSFVNHPLNFADSEKLQGCYNCLLLIYLVASDTKGYQCF